MTPHVLHVFSTFVPAGPEVRAVRLIAAFGDRFRHTVVAMDGRTDARELLPAGVDVRIEEPPPRAGSVRTVLALRRVLRRAAPDLLLTYNWGAFDAVMAARSLGLRNVVHHEDGFTPDEVRTFKRRRIRARRMFLPKVAAVFVPSLNLQRIARTHWGLSPELVEYVPNGIDLSAFAPRDGRAELRARLGIPLDAPVIGAVGHLRPEKNFARLLRAARPLCAERGAHVVLLGDGAERAELEALAATPPLAGRVHLVGHVAEPAPWYRLFDAFCLSSDSEQMPVSLLEAMASELPVAATEVGDVRQILPDVQAGGLVPLSDDAARTDRALTEALERLFDDPEESGELGRANRERVRERFSFESMRDAHLALWERGLAAGAR